MSGLLRKIGRSRLVKLPDGRKQVIDRFEVRSDAGDVGTVDSLVFIAFGTAHKKYTTCLLVSQPDLNFSGDQNVEQDLVRVYEEMPATGASPNEVQVGGDRLGKDSNGRHTITRDFAMLAAGTFTEGVIGSTIAVGGVTYALSNVSASSNGAVRRGSRTYIEATTSEIQVGGDDIGKDADNRRTVSRTYIQLTSTAFVEGTIGSTITVSTVTHALTSESKSENSAVRTIRRTYVEATSTLTQVGRDDVSTDSDGRRRLSRTYIQLTITAYTQGTIGTVEVAGLVNYALAGESKVENQAVRRVSRTYVEATTAEIQVGGDDITTDDDGRRRLRRTYVQLAGAPYVQGTIGSTTTSGTVNLVLSGVAKTENNAVRHVYRSYVEATASAVEIGYPSFSRGDDDRKTVSRQFIIIPRAAGAEPAALVGSIGVETFDGCVCSQASASQNVAYTLIRKTYIQATSTPAQIGDVQTGIADSDAYVGLVANAVGSGTKWAHEWSVQYLVSGDATAADTHWSDVSATLAFGARSGRLTGTSIVRRGVGFSIISRRYNEVPETYIFPQRGKFTFPGKLAYSSSLGIYIGEPSITREVTHSIKESYGIGPADGNTTPEALTYEPLAWAAGAVTYTRATGEAGSKTYNFAGCMGNFTISLTNKVFAGYLCSAVAGTVASNPTAYPTSGPKIISSTARPWRGNIWKRTSITVTFP